MNWIEQYWQHKSQYNINSKLTAEIKKMLKSVSSDDAWK